MLSLIVTVAAFLLHPQRATSKFVEYTEVASSYIQLDLWFVCLINAAKVGFEAFVFAPENPDFAGDSICKILILSPL